MARPHKGHRIQKSIKLDSELIKLIDDIRGEDVRDFSEQIEYWIRETLRERYPDKYQRLVGSRPAKSKP